MISKPVLAKTLVIGISTMTIAHSSLSSNLGLAQSSSPAQPTPTITPDSPKETPGQSLDSQSAVLINQLQASQKNLSSRNLPIKIVSYTHGPHTSLQSKDQIAKLQNQLVSEQEIVPQYDGLDPSSFTLNTIQKRMELNRTDSLRNQNVVSNIQSEVFPLIKTGQRTVDITWESQGKQFHTTCIYDDKGIVYDNILSNIALVQVNKSAIQAKAVIPKDTSTSQSLGKDVQQKKTRTYSFTYQPMNYELDWPWGKERGRITVDHTIVWNGYNRAYNQNGDPNAYMTLGTAEARVKPTILDNKHRYAKLAYGYAWATPSAKASISFSFDPKKGGIGGSFNVSVSSLGSSGKGDNHSTIVF